MKNSRGIVLILILSVIFLLFSIYSPERTIAGQRRHGIGGAISSVQYLAIIGHREGDEFISGIEPFRELRLGRYTRIIWENRADVPVRIRIGSGETCKEASEVMFLNLGTQFLMAGCYVTQKPVPPGGVMQTDFNEQGRFRYEVEYVGENLRETGVILVY